MRDKGYGGGGGGACKQMKGGYVDMWGMHVHPYTYIQKNSNLHIDVYMRCIRGA